MALRDLDRNSDSAGWDSKWQNIFDQYQRDLRHAHYIRSLLSKNDLSILEIAAGSFRDVAALRRMGIDCAGMDFSLESVTRAKEAFPLYADYVHQMSAFDMPFENKAFDVTYHNGFWGLFSDEQVHALAQEQARITRGRMFATVHNKHNARFADYFDRMKLKDPLYDIKFYTIKEITSLMCEVCDNVSVIPVGKYKRRHEDMLIRFGITSPALIRSYLKLSGHHLLDRSERLLCIGTPR